MLRKILKKLFCSHDWKTSEMPIIRLGCSYGEKYSVFIDKKCEKCEKEISTREEKIMKMNF